MPSSFYLSSHSSPPTFHQYEGERYHGGEKTSINHHLFNCGHAFGAEQWEKTMANRDEDRTGMQVDPYGNQVQVDIIQITDSHVDEFKAAVKTDKNAKLGFNRLQYDANLDMSEEAKAQRAKERRGAVAPDVQHTHGGPCDACKSHNAAVKASWHGERWNGTDGRS